MVGGVYNRTPGLWVKADSTLDVLSGGRAWLGIDAAWTQAESEGLGFPLRPSPALREEAPGLAVQPGDHPAKGVLTEPCRAGLEWAVLGPPSPAHDALPERVSRQLDRTRNKRHVACRYAAFLQLCLVRLDEGRRADLVRRHSGRALY